MNNNINNININNENNNNYNNISKQKNSQKDLQNINPADYLENPSLILNKNLDKKFWLVLNKKIPQLFIILTMKNCSNSLKKK